MHALYDIVCSVVIGGIVMVMLVGFNGNIVQQAGTQTIRSMAQTNLTAVDDMLEYEFRKMGYGVAVPIDSAILFADSNKIKFQGDLGNDGGMDTLTYFFNGSAASGQVNPSTRVLYRTMSPQPQQAINIGITQLKFFYYDSAGVQLSRPVSMTSKIKAIRISMNIESTADWIHRVKLSQRTERYLKYNPGVSWERTFKPKNLR